jgi:hypothetical protein
MTEEVQQTLLVFNKVLANARNSFFSHFSISFFLFHFLTGLYPNASRINWIRVQLGLFFIWPNR